MTAVEIHRDAIVKALKEFPWDNYGFDEVAESLEHSTTQDWVEGLTTRIVKELKTAPLHTAKRMVGRKIYEEPIGHLEVGE